MFSVLAVEKRIQVGDLKLRSCFQIFYTLAIGYSMGFVKIFANQTKCDITLVY